VSGSPLALSRRSLLRAAGGLSLTALAGTAVGCAPGGASDKTLRVAYFGDQKAADELRDRLRGPVRELDPDIALEITAVNGTDWNNFLAKVLTQIAAGTPPDVIGVPTEGLQLIAEKDLVIPLDDYVRRDLAQLQPYFDDVHPALVEAMMYQGSLFILPVDFNAGNMYYNAGLFEQAQVPAPTADWTVDTFYDACTRIARLPDVAAFNWVVRLWGSWTSFLYANGGNLLEEGKYPGGEWLWTSAYAGNPAAAGRSGGYQWGRPTANDPAVVEALDYMVALKNEGLTPAPDVGGGDTLQGLFASNRIGMAIGGGFWAGGLSEAGMAPGTFDVQYFPRWKSQRHLLGTGGYAIFRSSQKQDLAWEVVKKLLEPSAFDVLYPGNSTTSARRSLATAERYARTGPPNWQVLYGTLTDHADTAPIPAPPYYNALATSLNQRTTEAMASGNAKAALDGMQVDLENALKSS
jgi:multiple sugar transport system substrate-binding protein